MDPTENDDALSGSSEPDNLNGLGGDDTVRGGRGNDTLQGGAGRDRLVGQHGDDVIDSVDRPSNIFAGSIEPEADTVDGGGGNDSITGGRLDRLDGGEGNDFLQLNFAFNGPDLNAPAVDLTFDANGSGVANDGTSITGFEFVNLTLTNKADAVDTGNVRATLDGQGGDDDLRTGRGDDNVFGGAGDDTIGTGSGDDQIAGGAGDDRVFGGNGADAFGLDLTTDGADQVNLGGGADAVRFDGFGTGQYRVTFTSSEVGDDEATDSGGLANQDGDLAVRIQREDGSDGLIGPVGRFDDEGVTFFAGTQGILFDVRDLVSGTARGDGFEAVVLGTGDADSLSFFPPFRSASPYYYNGGQGNDTVTAGTGADFLVGGAGDDLLNGGGGADSFIGGSGSDEIKGGAGKDTAIFNVTTDGADTVRLEGGGDDFVVNASTATNVRLTFTSSEVGNGVGADSGTLANQDGGLAIRLQGETGGALSGPVTRVGDESVTFRAGAGVTFDVRDLPTGTERGEAFTIVMLGSSGADEARFDDGSSPVYANAGQGDDFLVGGFGQDFLVGGVGDDRLNGWFEDDQMLGGAGRDRLIGGMGDDTFVGGGGRDAMTGGAGRDIFVFTLAADSSADGSARDLIGKFRSGEDTIDLRALSIDDESDIRFTAVSDFKTVASLDLDDDGQFDDFSLLIRGDAPALDDFLI